MVGGRIMRLVVATMLNREPSPQPLHLQIAEAWAPDNKHAADLIRRALVLLADHELNASTFTVRCAASTGLNLYDAMIAGLVALKGPKHGGAGVLAAQLRQDAGAGRRRADRSASAWRSASVSPASATASTSTAIRARMRCWKRWRAPARTRKFTHGNSGAHRGSDRRIRQYRLCAGGAGAHAGSAGRP